MFKSLFMMKALLNLHVVPWLGTIIFSLNERDDLTLVLNTIVDCARTPFRKTVFFDGVFTTDINVVGGFG